MQQLCFEFENISDLRRRLSFFVNALDGVSDDHKHCLTPKSEIAEIRMDKRVKAALLENGLTTIEKVRALSAAEFIALPSLGVAALSEVNAILVEYNFDIII